MKKTVIAVVVIVLSALVMIGIQLAFNNISFANVDAQRVIVDSLRLDVIIYLVMHFSNRKILQ